MMKYAKNMNKVDDKIKVTIQDNNRIVFRYDEERHFSEFSVGMNQPNITWAYIKRHVESLIEEINR